MSWGFYNKAIRLFFDEEPPGFFIEAGAVDGIFQSNTLYLENQLNWTGLLVEPDKEAFERLLSIHRNAYAVEGCLSRHTYPEQVIYIHINYL